MRELEILLGRESDHIRVGRLAEGLAEAPQKTALAGAYLRGLQAVKANAVALARFAPEGIAALRDAHGRFSEVVAANQAVLATARSVSEGLLRNLSTELTRSAEPKGYGTRPAPSPTATAAARRWCCRAACNTNGRWKRPLVPFEFSSSLWLGIDNSRWLNGPMRQHLGPLV